MPTWWVKYHVVFEIDRGSEGTQISKHHNDMTIAEPDIHTEEQVQGHLEGLFTNSVRNRDQPIVDVENVPFDDLLSETLEIDETVLVIKYEP